MNRVTTIQADITTLDVGAIVLLVAFEEAVLRALSDALIEHSQA